jgi:hypothetical protein
MSKRRIQPGTLNAIYFDIFCINILTKILMFLYNKWEIWRKLMKKYFCLFVMIFVGFGLYAFDRSLNGSWGLVKSDEKVEFICFNTNEIIIMNTLFRSNNYEEADDTIYINFDGDSVVIQYYRLSSNKLLFIMWNTDNPEQSITLILSKI